MIKKKKYKSGKLQKNIELTSQEIKLVHRILTEQKDEKEHVIDSYRGTLCQGKVSGTKIIVKKIVKLLKKMEN
jgi:hypothetical protein